ncbi:aromatic ring-hydroxylating dioxygenase subunit alpha [Martelella mediterranea]|uniref:aromatic ring-hydroxylating oxygenase subunit alpha n=1 Tax=Martelella mediterranea TaxID=293089 RepID=UPI001E340664|nr:aromatic ring-hydroxylating dioxygenase subunit alpha [Martelella mediterranea]MCD1635073.1 aromatic ring-hydroxylating dioxygenase subunit alpha [Martelella mediterranea]
MTIRQKMLEELKNRRDGFTLARPFYTDPDYFRVDMENFYYRDWLFVAHDCELPRPGNYLTIQIGDYSVILTRGRDKQIRALHNSCRHRGSRVCSAEKGTTAKLVCPYHQWTYDLDGSLQYVRHMGEDFDKAQYGLKPVHCESIEGYIFICLADDAPDIAPLREKITPYIAPHNIRETKVAFKSSIIEKGNWKLVWENNRECYHCAANHPELCRTYPEAASVSGVQGMMDDPEIQAHWAHCEAAGLEARFFLNPDGQFRIARMPLIAGAESYTMSGQRAVRKPMGPKTAAASIGTLLLFHYPTTWNHFLGDHAISFRVLPLGPEETEVTTTWMVPKDAVEGIDYDLEELTHVWTFTNDQDRQIVEENARGIRSPAYEPGPYCEEDEGGVMQFVEWYANTSISRLSDTAAPLSIVA